MTSLALLHLVRAANEPEAFKAFVASYRRYPAGSPHEFILIYKGFQNERDIAAYEAMLDGHPHRKLLVSDEGYDLNAYFTAASHFEHDHFCFLNSYSTLQVSNWLAKLMDALQEPQPPSDRTESDTRQASDRRGEKGVGLVGATGSWQSIFTHYQELQRTEPPLPVHKWGHQFIRSLRIRYRYPPFPNPHIRTNGFLISRDLMRSIRFRPPRNKDEAYQFESGRDSLTRQVLNGGYQVRIVGRNGIAYPPDAWACSNTFRQCDQGNLLIADNQTRIYQESDIETRQKLARICWGDQAHTTGPETVAPEDEVDSR